MQHVPLFLNGYHRHVDKLSTTVDVFSVKTRGHSCERWPMVMQNMLSLMNCFRLEHY